MEEEDTIVIQEIGKIEEPPFKRPKLTDTMYNYLDNLVTSTKPLQAILSDEFDQPTPSTKVYVAQVKNVSEMSKIILTLNERFPIKELSHLKRATRKEVLLFPVTYLTSLTHDCIKKYIDEHLNEFKDSFEYYKIVDVPSCIPKTRKQYMECGKSWSCSFHTNKYLELLISGEIFSAKEIQYHRKYMGMAFEIVRFYLSKYMKSLEPADIVSSDINAAVVVDPYSESVVAVAIDNRVNQPIQHAAMLAIDNVAKTQKGGVWSLTTDIYSEKLKGMGEMELLLHLQNKFPSVKFGAREYIGKNELNEVDTVRNLSDAIKNCKNSPYLCTGYYIYLIREPCMMCAMGLVHARTKRVFFAVNNANGALGSKAKLQSVAALNHHFEVFTGFL